LSDSVGVGILFAKRFREAAAMSTKHEAAFKEFSATFSTETVSKWLRMAEKWEMDPAKSPNPYQEAAKGARLIFSRWHGLIVLF